MALEPLLAVEPDDPTIVRRSTTADVKATAARNVGFPLVRFRFEFDAATGEAEADRRVPAGAGGAVAGGDG